MTIDPNLAYLRRGKPRKNSPAVRALTTESPKTILLVAVDFPPVSGGISIFIYNLWRYFPQNRVIILAPFHGEAADFDNKQTIKVYRTAKPRDKSVFGKILTTIDLFFASRKIIREEKLHEIHCLHLVTTGIIGYLFRLAKKINYNVYVFGAEFSKYKKLNRLQKKILNNARIIIVISEFCKHKIREIGTKNGNLIKITPGVDLESFRPKLDYNKILNRYNLHGKKIIFTVSRLAPNKGLDTAIKTLPLVLEKVPNAVYLVGGEGPCKTDLKNLVNQMNLQDRVIFCGFIPDEELPLYYNVCDVFLLLTREIRSKGNVEGFGMVLIEAGACGKPVVGGRAGGTAEAIDHGITGYLVDPLNLQEASRALIELLSEERLAKEMGLAARRRAEKDFCFRKKSAELWGAISA
jgi:phosphatidylinositol alpha-1,6-mannosyltransferase